MDRPYVLLSCAVSLDGYLDDANEPRLVLSCADDLDRVDELRARSDAILVGAGTIRADNPRLLLHSQARRAARVARGTSPDPVRVTITTSGDLDPSARIFTSRLTAEGATTEGEATEGEATEGEAARLVYVASPALATARDRLGKVAEVVDAGDPADLARVLADLATRGVGRLMVEGGRQVLTQFLAADLADELRLAIAPFFVGDSRAPRFVSNGRFPWNRAHPARLANVTQVGSDAVLSYALSDRFQPCGGAD